MKKTEGLILAVVLSFIMIACGNEPAGKDGVIYKSGIAYNDSIVNKQMTFLKRYIAVLNREKLSEQTLQDLKSLSSEAAHYAKAIGNMPAYKGDSLFRDAGVEVFSFYSDFLAGELSTIIRLRMLTGDSVVHRYTDSINVLMNRNTGKESLLDEKFQQHQKAFAQKNGFRLNANTMENMVNKD